MNTAEKIAARVNIAGECWEWQGSIQSAGYGKFQQDGLTILAHRASYEAHVGPIPDGLQLDHLCRNRRCVNPSHLEPVTLRENVLRGEGPSAMQARQTHCIHGHEFTPENTRMKTVGGKWRQRQCCECHRITNRAYRARLKASAAGLRYE
jgi:hypothetical protein